MKPAEKTIEGVHLPLFECEKIGQAIIGSPSGPARKLNEVLAEAEKAAIERALDEAGGNRTQAAKRLGLSRQSLLYEMKVLGLAAPPRRERPVP